LLEASCEQWIVMPTKSVCARCEFVFASFHSGEPDPNTFVMSPEAEVEVFSSSMFAVATPPTSQPARVNGTHGAAVVLPVSVIMFDRGSTDASTGSVQYLNQLVNGGLWFALK
jgi:hypothetical protein